MAIVRCPNNHQYEDRVYQTCPFCMTFGMKAPTAPYGGGSEDGSSGPQVFAEGCGDDVTISKNLLSELDGEVTEKFDGQASEKTMSFMESAIKRDPIVGWLVCIEGPERGRDYRLRSEKNWIGRSMRMAVSIPDDKSIENENHALIVYDPKANEFSMVLGRSAQTYLNGTQLSDCAALNDGDTIKLGKSVFHFIAYCKEDRRWV
ncbi:MAG: FHA domain-containing protein [Clostridiales bacterium]|nr:FHA domain-containing protein [Clostridiales bacterium]